MKIDQIIKEYTPFLLKTAYLITRDRVKVEAIVEETFIKYKVGNSEFVKPSIIKYKLLECFVKSLNEYYKSWHYQKLIIKRIFDNGEQYRHPSFHDDLSYSILRLPLKLREIATLYFYVERTTAEISRLLGVPQGTVQQRLLKAKQLMNKPLFEEEIGQQIAPIDANLTEWDERAAFVEQKFIDTVDMIEVAQPNKNRKKIIVGMAVIGVAVLAIVISEFVTKKDAQSIKDQQQIGDLQQTYVQDTFEIFPGATQKSDALIPPDISLEIAKYFSYYLGTNLHSLSHSDWVGRDQMYTYYSTYYMLAKNNYPFDLERIKFFQELASTSHSGKKGNPDYNSFIQILNEQHNITEQEIIDYYFVPKELGVYFQQEFMKTYINQFDKYSFLEEYSKVIGYDSEKLYQDYVREQEAIESKYEELTDLSRLPIDALRVNAKFALDDEGQIIMLDPYNHFSPISEDQYYLIFIYENEFSRELNRLSLQDYILFLEEKYNEKINEEFLKAYIEGYKIIKRSIDLDLD